MCLLLPLIAIGIFAARMATGAAEFKDVTQITVLTPDGREAVFEGQEDLAFYKGILENAEFISTPVREIGNDTPTVVKLDETAYQFYLSQSPSGCMVASEDGRLRLLTTDDAIGLLVRSEMEYLYTDELLPTFTLTSGDTSYSVPPDIYAWQYRKADSRFYADNTTERRTAPIVCNLYSGLDRAMTFSTEPDNYSLQITRVTDDGSTVQVPATSLDDLFFETDTLLSVSVSAKWSQNSGGSSYGEASYRFDVLYDVPAVVELNGAQGGFLVATAGDLLMLKADYTNENEKLEIETDFETGNAVFYYDADRKASYALVAVDPFTEEGEYTLSVRTGTNVTEFALEIRDSATEGIHTLALTEEEYNTYASIEVLEQLEATLAGLRAQAGGRSLMEANIGGLFLFGAPCAGEPVLWYHGAVMIDADNLPMEDSGLRLLDGDIYKAQSGGEVRSVQSGVVLFAGELGPAGNAVVVSHGMGICSYYFHLSEVNVAAGDMLENGATIGKAGQSGLTEGKDCLQFMLSAGDLYFRP